MSTRTETISRPTQTAEPHKPFWTRRWPSLAGLAVCAVIVLSGGFPLYVAAIGVAACALVYVVWSQFNHQRRGLQLVGMAIFGAVAAAALLVEPDVGMYIVAAGLVGHATWDLVHHRTKQSVPQWYAEFCAVIDYVMAATILVLPLL